MGEAQGPEHAPAPQERDPAPDDAPGSMPPGVHCDICGAPMYERHCRIICPQCGYQRDCTDP
jgi:hypothetical protein